MRTSAVAHLPALVRASHPGPTVAVVTLVGLLAVGVGLPAGTIAILLVAIASGQASIGWGNDLVDRHRDGRIGRTDKPVATGVLPVPVVRAAIAIALVVCVGASLALGWRAAVVHLVLGVGAGWAYDLGAKRTAWSWLPYAVAFGSLPAIVTLAAPIPVLPPWWVVLAAAGLGVGAHLLNALPDLADDLTTGVRGLPQRLGPRVTQRSASAVLVAASVLVALGPPGRPGRLALGGLAAVAACVVVAGTGTGRAPFRAAIAIAAVDVVLLVLAL